MVSLFSNTSYKIWQLGSLTHFPFLASFMLGFDTDTSSVRMRTLMVVFAQLERVTKGQGNAQAGSSTVAPAFLLFLSFVPSYFLPPHHYSSFPPCTQECRSCCEGMICNVELPTNHTNAVFAVMHAQRTSGSSVPSVPRPYLLVLAWLFMLPLL